MGVLVHKGVRPIACVPGDPRMGAPARTTLVWGEVCVSGHLGGLAPQPEAPPSTCQNRCPVRPPKHPPEAPPSTLQNRCPAHPPKHPPEAPPSTLQNRWPARSPKHPPEAPPSTFQNRCPARPPKPLLCLYYKVSAADY